MSHLQHSAFVFLLDVASIEKFSFFISEMDMNLIRSKVSKLLLPNNDNTAILQNHHS